MTLEEENATLKARVATLEAELGMAQDVEQALAIRRRLVLTPQEAMIVYALMRCYPRAAQAWVLEHNLPSFWRTAGRLNFIRVHVSHIRRKLGKGVIVTVGASYRLSAEGLAIVQAAEEPTARAA